MKLLAALAILVALVSPPGAQAQTAVNQRVYTVEIIVFRNLSGSGGPEDWTAKPVARGPDKPDTPVTGRFVQSVPASQFQLNDVAARLQNTTNYQPLAHFAWQQTASSWGSRAGFPIAKLAGNVPGLSGIIYLESGTYLHLGMSLNYQTSNPPAALGADAATVFTLAEAQRVLPFKPSYFDHPAFGVIALVTYAKPATGGR
ncbi:MAG TPA: CsiV family protein [Steroidobacteraceae bacterium]|jgi:Peptidoglycan-binding protein, CsiV|nr:CsiV family protein [Steroidobacteraceae bacterium]